MSLPFSRWCEEDDPYQKEKNERKLSFQLSQHFEQVRLKLYWLIGSWNQGFLLFVVSLWRNYYCYCVLFHPKWTRKCSEWSSQENRQTVCFLNFLLSFSCAPHLLVFFTCQNFSTRVHLLSRRTGVGLRSPWGLLAVAPWIETTLTIGNKSYFSGDTLGFSCCLFFAFIYCLGC